MPWSLTRICEILNSFSPDLAKDVADREFDSLAALHRANSNEISFYRELEISRTFLEAKAALILVPRQFQFSSPQSILLYVDDVDAALNCLLSTLDPWRIEDSGISFFAEIHPTAVVDGNVGPGSKIGPFCYIPAGASVGANCRLDSHVSLYSRVQLGDDVWVQSGAVLGADGFGFGSDPLHPGSRHPHYGGLRVGNEVHIGAQTCIAAGWIEPTRIGSRTKIDNLVQIGHNVQIGSDCYLAGQCGVAGSAELGNGVLIGGAAVVSGHVFLADGVIVSGRAGVLAHQKKGVRVSGFPAREHRQWLRTQSILNKIASQSRE